MSEAPGITAETRALVTGGGGFLGGAIARALIERGARVRSFARGDYPELRAMGVETARGDLADAGAIADAAEGCDVVFHVAAKAGIWGPRRDYFRANVEGTRNAIAACRRRGIARLIFTSTPSVVFDGRDMEGVDESVPYPARYEAPYPETKAIAEREVLAANGAELATVALRPHLIWGPGDRHLAPRIVARARAGRLRRIGDGTNRVDTTYIDDAAEAHLNAAERLAPGSAIAGRAYFISSGDPRRLWEIVDMILEAAGLPPVRRSISAGAAYKIGAVMEAAWRALRLRGEPPMTRFAARELAAAHWFDLTAARRDLGYEPRVTIEEGMARLKAWFERRAESGK